MRSRAGLGAALVATTLLTGRAEPQSPVSGPGSKASAEAALARATFEATARVLTVYDARGAMVRTVGDRAVYTWPAFSPDGMRLAVSQRDELTGNTDIWVYDLSTGSGIQITSDKATDISPVWSADGRQIVYASDLGGSAGLYRRASDGSGNAALLYDPGVPFYITDWSTDGRLLSVSDPENLYVLSPGTGTPPRHVPGGGGRFSPDGRLVAYVSVQSGRSEIWVRPIDPPETGGVAVRGPWQISGDEGGAGMIFWRGDGKEIYYLTPAQDVMAVDVSAGSTFTAARPRRLFRAPETISGSTNGTSVSRDGRQFLFNVPPPPRGARFPLQVTVFDRAGNTVRTLASLRGETTPTTPVLSPDGRRVAMFLDNDITVFDVGTGGRTQVTASRAAVKTPGDQQSPVWSADGRQIAFVSFRQNVGHVYRVPSDGTRREERLYSHLPDIYAMPLADWSPDGRFLSFDVGGVSWVLPVGGPPAQGGRARELMREEFNVFEARFSPDSRYVAYVSDESGRNEVFVRPFDPAAVAIAAGGAKVQVSRQGGLGQVQWRQDGRELLFVAPDGYVIAADVTTVPSFRASAPRRIFKLPGAIPLVGVFDRQGINAPGCSDATLERCEPGSISRDGQRFAFNVPVPPVRQAIAVAPRVLAEYAGTYVQDGIDWVVSLERNQLMIQRTAREKVPLYAETDTRFFLRATNGDFEFVRDEAGTVRYLFLYRGGAPVQLIRR